MRHRNITIPPSSSTMKLPFLSHPSFKSNTESWAKNFVHKFKEHCIPFHQPSFKLIECRHIAVGDKLFNWKAWYTSFAFGQPTTCVCENFIKLHPGTPTVQGHVAAPAAVCFQSTPELQSMLASSSKNTFYTAKQHWLAATMKMFKKWAAHHGLPETTCENWHEYILSERSKHYNHLIDNPAKFKFKHIVRIKNETEGFAMHNEDHAPTKFMIYCPLIYY